MVQTYSYDEWGDVTASAGNVDDNPYQYAGRYGYYTHYQETDFELLQLGVRYYDPKIGRFTSRDPAEQGIDWYIYADDNPMLLTDPLGMYPKPGCHAKHPNKSAEDCVRKVLSEAPRPKPGGLNEGTWSELLKCFKGANIDSLCNWIPCAMAEQNPKWFGYDDIWPNACDQEKHDKNAGRRTKMEACNACAFQRFQSCLCRAVAKSPMKIRALATASQKCKRDLENDQATCLERYPCGGEY